MRTGRVAFGADAEELGLHRVHIELSVDLLLKDGVERLDQALARTAAVGGGVLHAIGDPKIGQAGAAEGLADASADLTTTDAVVDPELAGGLIGAAQRYSPNDLGVGEKGRVKVEANLDGPGPGNPVLELLDAELVAIHLPPAHLGVAGMEVEAVAAGNGRKGLLEVRPQFVRRAGFAGVVTGNGQSAAKLLPGVLEAADIIPLPAMNGDGDVGKLLECFSGVHPQGGIAFFGEAVGLFDLSIGAHVCRFKMLSDSQVCAMVAASLSRGNTRFCPVSAPPKQVAAALTLRQTGGACR